MEKKLFLISNSVSYKQGYLSHCENELKKFLKDVKNIIFIPYALKNMDGYTKSAEDKFSSFNINLKSIHKINNKLETIKKAQAIFIGGGNTFRLLDKLYQYDLIDVIRKNVLKGKLLYVGASAGSNMACPTIKTTNDMPIVQPPSFSALNLIPFQINPHYIDPDINSKHMGETREKRINEFHEENKIPVVGLREGSWLHIEGNTIKLQGKTGAVLFEKDKIKKELLPGEKILFT